MPKSSRPHAPGCVFHITARTQGHHPWFTETLRTRVACEITDAARSSGVALFAFAIMPNHFHIILRQGSAPLSYMMHRVMHRTAMLLKQAHNLEGHVFERRYRSGLCTTADHVRRAIVYTHLNPYRASLCDDPAEYHWSSHCLYMGATDQSRTLEHATAIVDGLKFFAKSSTPDDALQQYIAHVRFQIAVDRVLNGNVAAHYVVAPDTCAAGDEHWTAEYATSVDVLSNNHNLRPIYDVALQLLARIDANCPLDLVRTNSRMRAVVALRRSLVAALIGQGYRGVDVARFMGVTPAAVSNIAGGLRNDSSIGRRNASRGISLIL